MTPVADRPVPRSKTELFTAFSWLALQGFGGVLAVVQRELVEKKQWLTPQEFIEDWAVAQTLPGPNVVNLSLMIGGRHWGLGGALSALAGILLFPTLLALLLAATLAGFSESAWVQGMLRGMGAVSAGLIFATGIKLAAGLRTNPMGSIACMLLAVLTFVGVALLRWPLAVVLFGVGSLGCLWAWVRIGQESQS